MNSLYSISNLSCNYSCSGSTSEIKPVVAGQVKDGSRPSRIRTTRILINGVITTRLAPAIILNFRMDDTTAYPDNSVNEIGIIIFVGDNQEAA